MNSLETADRLVILADEIRRTATKPIGDVDTTMTLREADRILCATLKEYEVELIVKRYSFQTEPSIEWRVWDSKTNYKSPSLAAAVRAAIAANGLHAQPKPKLDEVQKVLGDPGDPTCPHQSIVWDEHGTQGMCDGCGKAVTGESVEAIEAMAGIVPANQEC